MLYSTVFLIASAFAGFATAQNTTFDTPIPCCTVPANQVPADQRAEYCNANQNTCVNICGGQGNIASNGNTCDSTTLQFTCKCANGTNVDNNVMKSYQQSVPGQVCRFWYGACINATGSNAAQQFQCVQARNAECGNLTFQANAGSSSAGGASASGGGGSRTSGAGSSPTSGGATATSSHAGAAAIAQYATPVLAGGLLALFGIAL